MTFNKIRNYIYIVILFSGLCCRQIYTPPNSGAKNNFLVVDGIIISGNDSTIINLSRAQPISDSIYYFMPIPESGAKINLTGSLGDSYNLTENYPGYYSINQLALNSAETYKLKIITSNGEVYLSDSIPVKLTPAVDSVTWQFQNDGVHIYVNTHDPLDATRYYRWKYSQTYQYRSAFGSEYIYQNGMVIVRDSNQNIFNCWKSNQSSGLLLGSSANLVNDLISQQPINFIPYGSEELGATYSILVEQFAISSASYSFWQLLLQNTEQLGSLFDPQPTQLPGNIHSVSNPNEPVLGYMSAATLQEQRIFIQNAELPTWGYSAQTACSLYLVSPDSFAYYYGIGYIPVSQNPPPAGGYYSSLNTCVDCTLQGGTNVKPSFWPN